MHSKALTGELLHTYQTLVEDASTPTASWSDVRALLEALGEVTPEDGGNLTIARNGHLLTLHPALTKGIAESGEVNALRRFLRNSESKPVVSAGRDPHLLLVIHGADARLYRCQVIGGVPQLLLPYEESVPNPEDRPMVNRQREAKPRKEGGSFASTAEDLQAAGQIVIFDTGGEADAFTARLSQHDSETSRRIIGTVHLRELPLDNAGLLVELRKFYATLERVDRADSCQSTADIGVR